MTLVCVRAIVLRASAKMAETQTMVEVLARGLEHAAEIDVT